MRLRAEGLDYASVIQVGVAAATRTLPRAIGTFTGREAELHTLVTASAALSGTGGVVGIHAIGGMRQASARPHSLYMPLTS